MSIKRTLAGIGLALSVAFGGSAALASDDVMADLEQMASQYRELEIIEPLDINLISRDELRQENEERAGEDFPHDETADWNNVLIFLGYIEDDQNIADIYSGFMGDQILGYYDPETKRLVIVATSAEEWGPTDQSTFVHETVHALQDQHFDLRAIQEGDGRQTDDLYFARTALIEGDASLAEQLFLVQEDLLDSYIDEVSDLDQSAVENAPLFLTESLYFPYLNGAEFVFHLWQEGGWDAVNDAWQNPPNTSEQIMHPEKFLDGEEAIVVAINDPLETLGDEWRLLEYNENGELGHYIFLLNGGASESDARTASEGWGGDSTFIVTNDDEIAMVWTSAWDSEEDAQEYYDALVAVETERLGATQESVDNGVELSADDWSAVITLDGDVVTHYMAYTAETVDVLQESQMDATPLDVIPGMDEATPVASPVSSVSFWVRES